MNFVFVLIYSDGEDTWVESVHATEDGAEKALQETVKRWRYQTRNDYRIKRYEVLQ